MSSLGGQCAVLRMEVRTRNVAPMVMGALFYTAMDYMHSQTYLDPPNFVPC